MADHVLEPAQRTTPAMKGRIAENVPLDEMSDPTTTAGTLPMMIDVVRANSTCRRAASQRWPPW